MLNFRFQLTIFILSSIVTFEQQEFSLWDFTFIQLDEENVAFGSLSKYCIFCQKYQIESIEKEKDIQNFLIYFINHKLTKQPILLHFTEFDLSNTLIIHKVNYYGKDFKQFTFAQKNLNYEGKWFLQFNILNKISNQLTIGLMGEDYFKSYDLLIDQQYMTDLIFYLNSFQNSSDLNLEIITNIKFNLFLGKTIFFNTTNLQKLFIDLFEKDKCLIIGKNKFVTLFEFSSEDYLQISTQECYRDYYKLTFWSKIDMPSNIDGMIYLIQLSVSQQNSFDSYGNNSFILTYQIQPTQQYYIVEYYSYLFPIFKSSSLIDTKIFKYQLEKNFFTEWHFVQFEYNFQEITFQIKNLRKQQEYHNKFYQVHQFRDAIVTIYIGGNNLTKSSISGQVGHLMFYNYEQQQSDKKLISCHYSCDTCFGPFSNQCYSCANSQKRILDENQHTCNCELWNLEKNEQCLELNSLTIEQLLLPTDERFEKDFPNPLCSFGYFLFQDECIQCPSASQIGSINCIDCLISPDKWLENGLCKEQLIQFELDEKNTYFRQAIGQREISAQFFLIDLELFSCDDCLICTYEQFQNDNSNCLLYPKKHLNKDTYISCQFGEFSEDDQKCRSRLAPIYRKIGFCGDNCGRCQFKQCQFCTDPQQYYMDVFGFCQLCLLPHCKYCFQYNQYDNEQVQYNEVPLSTNEEDYIVACSLCFSGFIFDFFINQCIPVEQINDKQICKQGYITNQQELVCTSSQNPEIYSGEQAIEFSDCTQYFSNCLICLQDQNKMMQCIRCYDSYYLNLDNRICQQCSSIDQHSKRCAMLTSSYDNWKFDVMSFYLNFLPSKNPISVQGLYFINIYAILECQKGYIFFFYVCVKQIYNDCDEYDISEAILTCKTCKQTFQEFRPKTYFSNKCQVCPYPCQICDIRNEFEIFSINPYFIVTDENIPQTYKCLKNYDINTTFLDFQTGNIRGRNHRGLRYFSQVSYINQFEQESLSEVDEIEQLLRIKPYSFIQNQNNRNQIIFKNIRQNIFSLKNITFMFDGQNQNFNSNQIIIINSTTVIIQNLKFSSIIDIIFLSSAYGVQIILKNLYIENLNLNSNFFDIYKLTYLYIETITINSINAKNAAIFYLNNFFQPEQQIINIVIKQISISNSTFFNSQIIIFQELVTNSYRLEVQQITIENCSFHKSNILKFQHDNQPLEFNIYNIQIQSSEIIQSYLFHLLKQSIYFSTINIVNCQFDSSIYLFSKSKIFLTDLYVIDSLFRNSCILSIDIQQKQQFHHILKNLEFQNITFSEKGLINIMNQEDQLQKIEILQVQIKSLQTILTKTQDQFICLFNLQSDSINILNFYEEKNGYYWDFCLLNFENIFIQNFTTLTQLYQSQDTFKKNINSLNLTSQYGILMINEFSIIKFNQILVSSFNLTDTSLIQIKSYLHMKQNQSILFENSKFMNNSLIKTNIYSNVNIINIVSEYFCKISLFNISIHNTNIVHLEDTYVQSPGLILIITISSIVEINNNNYFNNSLLNSRNSLLNIVSEKIIFCDLFVMMVNSFQNSIQSVKSFGGFAWLKTNEFFIYNSSLISLSANQGACFYLILFNTAQFIAQNISIFNSRSYSTSQSISKGGAIYIDASSAQLIMSMIDFKIDNSFSEGEGGFLYMIGSLITNQVRFVKFQIQNVFSQKKILFQLDFDNKSQDNFVELSHVKIINSDQNLQLSNSESSEFIEIVNSQVKIRNFEFQGPVFGIILAFKFVIKIELKNLFINQVTSNSKYVISLDNYFVQNLARFIAQTHLIDIVNMTIQSTILTDLNQPVSFLFINISESSYIYKIKFSQLHFFNNKCLNCLNGMFMLKSNSLVNKIILKELIFFQNNCGDLSCVEISINNIENDQEVLIQDSKFINNIGTIGGALHIQNQKVNLKNIDFLFNQAQIGGGLYYNSNFELKKIKNLIFLQNEAEIGGAASLRQSRLSLNSLKQILYIQNKARHKIDNFQVKPSFLQMMIFSEKIETLRNYTHGYPNLTKYQINQFIYLPSGQNIGNYSILSQKEFIYIKYQLNLQLLGVNYLGEQQIQLEDINCQIILDQDLMQIQTFLIEQNFTLKFNHQTSSFNFDDLIIIFDPYEVDDKAHEISLKCNIIEDQNYIFSFKFKTFPCQMGEFYFEKQCLKCDWQKGFYSIDKKSTQCQKVDPKIIQANTATQIQLFPGYWRPNYFNSKVSKCQKNQKSCLGGWIPGDASCLDSFIGANCEECDIYNSRGYGKYFKDLNFNCIECNEFTGKIVYSIFSLFLTILSMFLTVNGVFLIFKSFKRLKRTTNFYKLIFIQELDQTAASIRVILTYCQIIVCVKTFQLNIPTDILNIFLPLSNPVQSSTFSIECIFNQYQLPIIYSNLLLNLLTPICYYLTFLSIYLGLVYFKKMSFTPSIYFTALLYLYFYTQPHLVKELGQLLAKRTISNISYINKNVSFLYDTNLHQFWIFFLIIPLLVLIGFLIPILLYTVIYKKRKSFSNEKTRESWGYIFNDYKQKSYYWEILKLFQREIIMLSMIFNEESVIMKGVTAFLGLLVYFLLFEKQKPYNVDKLNLFELKCLILSSLIIILSCVSYEVQIKQFYNLEIILILLIGVLIGIFCLNMINRLIYVYSLKYNKNIDQIKLIINYKYPKLLKLFPSLKKYLTPRSVKRINAINRFKKIKNNIILTSKSLNKSISNIYKQTISNQKVQIIGDEIIDFTFQNRSFTQKDQNK